MYIGRPSSVQPEQSWQRVSGVLSAGAPKSGLYVGCSSDCGSSRLRDELGCSKSDSDSDSRLRLSGCLLGWSACTLSIAPVVERRTRSRAAVTVLNASGRCWPSIAQQSQAAHVGRCWPSATRQSRSPLVHSQAAPRAAESPLVQSQAAHAGRCWPSAAQQSRSRAAHAGRCGPSAPQHSPTAQSPRIWNLAYFGH